MSRHEPPGCRDVLVLLGVLTAAAMLASHLFTP